MDFVVEPAAPAGGTVAVPGDKSISHRALMLAAIAEGSSRITGFLAGEDCLATLAALRALGVGIERRDDEVTVHGAGLRGLKQSAQDLDLGNSGTGLRLLTGLLCAQDFDSVLTGDDSLRRRPMQRIVTPLEHMGARIESRNGTPPLTVRGKRRLAGIAYELPVASAQVKSAILLAALYAAGDTCVGEPAPTRDHTERLLRAMGADIEWSEGRVRIRGGQALHARDVQVPADISSAAFFVLLALIAPGCEVLLDSVGVNPARSGSIEILREMGADIRLENPRFLGAEPVADIRVRSSKLRGIRVGPGRVPGAIDEFPVLFVAAAAARGATRFEGIGELRVKESDRIAVMARALAGLGIRVEESPDGAVVHGGTLAGGTVDSGGDHRIAMSLAVAGTVAAAPVRILDVDNVATSFPGFAALLEALGGRIATAEGQTA
ncbi:MAG TPA: 3-phosphoshikimate 1-carboxyvinyltransferase [Woeseiaceae bacterium]|nr:3-phosphoshikimate 1-carboxyvinyltransferase [Woeseiaceae bacterium]